MTEMAVDVLHTRPMTDLHLYIYVLWNLFNIQRFLFVTTETNLKVVVYDKTTGQKLKETDIDAEPFDITVVRPFSNDTVHGNCMPPLIIYCSYRFRLVKNLSKTTPLLSA